MKVQDKISHMLNVIMAMLHTKLTISPYKDACIQTKHTRVRMYMCTCFITTPRNVPCVNRLDNEEIPEL